MWNRRVLSTLGRQDRSRSYVDRTPRSCPGSWDAPLLAYVNGEPRIVCSTCRRPARLNAHVAVKQHPKAS